MMRTRPISLLLLVLFLNVLDPAMAQEEGDGFTPATGSQTQTSAVAVKVSAPSAATPIDPENLWKKYQKALFPLAKDSQGKKSSGKNKVFEALESFFEGVARILAGIFGGTNDKGNSSTVAAKQGATPATNAAATSSAALPRSVALNVPMRNQRDPANGEPRLRDSACGPASLGMAMEFYGINISTPQLMSQSGMTLPANPKEEAPGVNGRTLMAVASQNGFPAFRSYAAPDQNWLKAQLAAGNPVIMRVVIDKGGHFMVATGYDEAGNIHFNDPWDGVPRIYTPARLAQEWLGGAWILR